MKQNPDVQTAKFISISDIAPACWGLDFFVAISEDAPFSWGDNNHTLIDLESFLTYAKDRPILHDIDVEPVNAWVKEVKDTVQGKADYVDLES